MTPEPFVSADEPARFLKAAPPAGARTQRDARSLCSRHRKAAKELGFSAPRTRGLHREEKATMIPKRDTISSGSPPLKRGEDALSERIIEEDATQGGRSLGALLPVY